MFYFGFFFPFSYWHHTVFILLFFKIIIKNFACAVVREKRGPYNDPQHAYFYEGEDVWMAPGFINQFYEVRLTGKPLS